MKPVLGLAPRSAYNVSSRLDGMQIAGKALLKRLRGAGCEVVRQTGSHVRVRCGDCFTTVPVHAGETLPVGTLKQIERDLVSCLGKGWLNRLI